MFYPVVEEYVMHNRQRELAKELELKRMLRNSLESNFDTGSYLLAKAGGRLRNLARFFKVDTSPSIDDEMSLDCVTS